MPDTVAERMARAVELRSAYEKIAAHTGDFAGTLATWDTVTDKLLLYRVGTTPNTDKIAEYIEVRDIEKTSPDWDIEILIKRSALSYVAPVFDTANALLGGRTPLSNGIVSGLMLGGLGYGAGTLAENLFPERYMQRGKLRRSLGMLGAAGGLGIGLNNAYATSQRTGRGFLQSLITPNTTKVPIQTPDGVKFGGYVHDYGQQQIQSDSGYTGIPNAGLFAPTISVPQFNNAAWNDVQRGLYTGGTQFTPPVYAAAATGLMSGISAAQRSPIIRPVDVIRGIASAGVGLATANVAGRALSALAGLTPEGQNKLQDMGLWGGMMHAIVPAIFNR